MKSVSLTIGMWMALCWCVVPGHGPCGCGSVVRADDGQSDAPRITATEPAALVTGSRVTLKVRGFKLRDATELRFPAAAATTVEISETKDAAQPKGLENKIVGDTQLLAELTLPSDLPAGLMDYVIVTPAGNVTGKIMILPPESVIDEREPDDGFHEAQDLRPGQSARGSIQSDKDVDVFAYPGRSGQRIRVTVTSGGPLLMDAELYCYDARGQFLAAADDDVRNRDPSLTLTLQTDGTVFLCVGSAHDVGGEWHSYLLTVEDVQ